MSSDPSVFSSLQQTSGSQVRSAGGQNHTVTGVRNIDVRFLSRKINISFVLYTPGITKNLLSVGSLTDQNKTLIFRSEGCFVINNFSLAIEAFAPREATKGLYRLKGVSPTQGPEINSLRLSSKVALWHKRLGHFHTRGLQRMINSAAVKGLPPLQFTKHTCGSCQLGKQARSKMPK